MDWNESQWWLNTTKNESLKWKSGGRNRTKVYIYPSYSHFDDIDIPNRTTVRASSVVTTSVANTIATTINHTTNDEESLIILPGIWITKEHVQLNFQACIRFHSLKQRSMCFNSFQVQKSLISNIKIGKIRQSWMIHLKLMVELLFMMSIHTL